MFSRLRILIVVDCYYPSKKSSAKLVHDLAVELVLHGHEAVVLTPSHSIATKIDLATEDGISVVRIRNGKTKEVRKIRRAINEARLSAVLWRRAKLLLQQHPCDLILFYSPTIFFGALVRKLKRLWSCPAYLILRDIFPDWAVDAGLLRKGLIHRFFRKVALDQYRIADVIAVQSPGDLHYFTRAFPQVRSRPEVLFNWCALNEGPLPCTNWRARLALQNKTIFLYGGNLGTAQDLENIVRLAERLAFRPDIHFLLIGSGSEMPRLLATIIKKRLRNIQTVPGLSQQEYLSMVSECDIGLISLDARLTTQNIPGKLLSYLYWGLPVLASVNSGNDLFALLHDQDAGLCLLNGHHEQLARAALRLADDAQLRSAMGRNARRLLEQTFSVTHAVEQIFAHLTDAGFRFPTAPQIPLAAARSPLRFPELSARI
jgi:glycosyltransferase involved in cell wall biosynthesis